MILCQISLEKKKEENKMMENSSRASFDEREDQRYALSKGKRVSQSKRKLRINQKHYDGKNSQASSFFYHSHLKSPNSIHQFDGYNGKTEASILNINYFTEKYLPRGKGIEHLNEEMKSIIERKVTQLESIRIYRDELKYISSNASSIKISLNCFREKAKMEEQIISQIFYLEHWIKQYEEQAEMMQQYAHVLKEIIKEPPKDDNVIDIGKEEQIMIENLQLETNHLIKELAEQKRRNMIELRQIQEEILELRIIIKQKQDNLRDLKAKICTLYIKLHNRNNSRTGSKSKERNLSMSIKKFNNQNHNYIKEAFIGNNQFKNFSKEGLEKVASDEEMIKLKVFSYGKQNLTFQCIYKSKEGVIHSYKELTTEIDNETTRDKISEENQRVQEVFIKYLFSIKFYYKSKIVGVEYRIKSEKGNKSVQIGNCTPSIEHQLLTLINKQVVTIGSFWHGKEMIGVSVWYSDKKSNAQKNLHSSSMKKMKKNGLKSYDQYYV